MSLHCAWIKCSMKERNSKKSAKFWCSWKDLWNSVWRKIYWVFVYKLSGCGFEPSYCPLSFNNNVILKSFMRVMFSWGVCFLMFSGSRIKANLITFCKRKFLLKGRTCLLLQCKIVYDVYLQMILFQARLIIWIEDFQKPVF